MDELWLAAPCPALRLHGGGGAGALRWHLNGNALEWAARHGVSDADWAALAARQAVAAGSTELTRDSIGPRQTPLHCRRVPMADGWLVWLRDDGDANGQAASLAGVALDITTLEAEREQASKRMLQLSDALGFGLWTRDVPTQRIEWDAQMYRLYGRAPGAGPPTVQEFFERYVHPLDVDALLAAQNKADQEWAPEVHSEFRIQTPDGVRWVAAWTRREVRDGRRAAFGAHVDVTERHNAADARRDKESAEQASRAQAEFVAHLSHELRTPLNAVLGFAQLIDDDRADPLSPSQRERLRPLLAAASRLRSLVDDTLDLTRLEADRHSMQIEPVNLAKLCTEPSRIAVLCIEDNEINVLLMREMFAMRPEVDLVCELDGASGIAAALLHRPAVVLLDLHLPDMHGVQVLQRLRQEPSLQAARIIALSANAMPADVRGALAAGFDDYWTKPIDFTRFQAGMDEIVANVRTHRGES